MQETERLEFVSNWLPADLNSLWQNCFAGAANYEHMNRHVPYPVTEQWQLDYFMNNAGPRYNAWIIKRKQEKDVIGFVIQGDFFPGLPNNIGFNIGLNYTRQGYATESLRSLVDYLQDRGYTETFGHCFATNTASISCMEACGFENMGVTGRRFGNNIEVRFRKGLEVKVKY